MDESLRKGCRYPNFRFNSTSVTWSLHYMQISVRKVVRTPSLIELAY